ncbi:MAG TPA: hypothetical protein VFE47_04685 [Tepidisphaeraceae bacterium]|jgi:translation elongation factor P/translation initiation factor 5A|nr:hypothetical protein [Tepidisphaeraceae bacterium]
MIPLVTIDIDSNDIKPGMILAVDDELYQVETFGEFLIRIAPRYGFVIRHVKKGNSRQHFCSGRTQIVRLPERELQYLYAMDTGNVLFDAENNREFCIPLWLGKEAFLQMNAGDPVLVGFWEGRPSSFRPKP